MSAPILNMAGRPGDARPAHRALKVAHRSLDVAELGNSLGTEAPASTAGAVQGFTVTLPLPPSANNLFKAVGRGRAKTQEYKDWIEFAGWALMRERPSPVDERYALLLALPQAMRGDLDNRLKAVGDLLVSHKLTPDDRHADLVMAHRSKAVSGAACIVTVVPILQVSEALAGVVGGPRHLPVLLPQEGAEAA